MPRHYTFSKVMCWVAAAPGGRAGRAPRPCVDAAPWRAVGRHANASACSTRAYNRALGFFTQALDGSARRRVEPAARHARDRRRPRPALRLDRARLRARAGRDGLMQRYTHADDFGDDDERVHDLLVLVGRGAGDDRPARRGRALLRPAGRATPIRWGSSPRTSSRTRAGCSATSPRPTPTSASSTRPSRSASCSKRATATSARGARGHRPPRVRNSDDNSAGRVWARVTPCDGFCTSTWTRSTRRSSNGTTRSCAASPWRSAATGQARRGGRRQLRGAERSACAPPSRCRARCGCARRSSSCGRTSRSTGRSRSRCSRSTARSRRSSSRCRWTKPTWT